MMLDRSILISLSAVVVAIGLTGCVDEEAKRRSEVGRSLEQIEFKLAVAQGDSAELEQINTELKTLQGGSKGQQAAINLLRAGLARTLASDHVATFDAANAAQELAMTRAAALATVIAKLNHFGSAHGTAFSALNSDDLAARKAASETTASMESSQLQELEGPIESLADSIATGSSQSRSLRTQAGSKLQDASAVGRIEGLDTFMEAMAIQRNADAIDRDVALSEIELELTFQPDHDLASARQQAARQLIEEIDIVTTALQTTIELSSSSVAQINDACTAMGVTLTAALDQIGQRQSGELATAYTAAMGLLNDAAQAASLASSGLDRSSRSTVHTLEARVLLTKADLAMQSARSLEREARLRSWISEAGLPGIGDQTAKISALNDAAATLLDAAPMWYEEAINLLGDLGTNGAAIIADVQSTIDSIHGLGSASTGLDISIGGSGDGMSPQVDSSSVPGDVDFDGTVPPALLQVIQEYNTQMGTDLTGFLRVGHLVHATTPQGISLFDALQGVGQGLQEFDQAIRSQFGPEGAAVLDGFMDLFTSGEDQLDTARLTMDSSTTASIPPTGMDPIYTRLSVINGSWMFDFDAMTARQSTVQDNFIQKAQDTGDNFRRAAAQIQSGAYATVQEAMGALQPGGGR